MSIKRLVTGIACALVVASTASAHTVSVGSTNAGGPGSVTIWLGSYHNGAAGEGTMQILAGPTIPGVNNIPATQVTSTKPATLTDGVNNFYSPNGGIGGGTSGQFDSNSFGGPASLLPVRWQGFTFSGLSAGVYTYQMNNMSTVNWRDWNTDANNWRGQFTISGQTAGEVPEPGTLAIWSILGLGGAFVGYRRRRKAA